jgi:hypothetical protein
VTVESRETFFAFAVLAYVYLYLRGAPRLTTTTPDARRLMLPDGRLEAVGYPEQVRGGRRARGTNELPNPRNRMQDQSVSARTVGSAPCVRPPR